MNIGKQSAEVGTVPIKICTLNQLVFDSPCRNVAMQRKDIHHAEIYQNLLYICLAK